MDDLLTTIKEVQEGGKHLANWYLDHGYILLAIQPGAWPKVMPHSNPHGPQYYVRKNPIYVVGRPDGVESAPPFRGREKPADETGHEAAEPE